VLDRVGRAPEDEQVVVAADRSAVIRCSFPCARRLRAAPLAAPGVTSGVSAITCCQ